jgi:streptogrisin B
MRIRRFAAAVAAAVAAVGIAVAQPAAAATAGHAAPVKRPGVLSPAVSPGDTVYGSGGIACAAGVNAHSGSTYYLILPGHCTAASAQWYTSPLMTASTYIGPTVATSFPGNDYGLVRYDNPAIPHPQTFTSAGNAFVGESVCMKSRTTGVHCGTVTALNQSVAFSGGVVSGLIRTNVCAEPGDNGGVLYSGTTALGILVGGSGNCSSGGTTYFQPLTEILAAYGLTL